MDDHYPWFVDLFVIYLLCVLVLTLVRVGTLMWTLRKLRKLQERDVPFGSVSQGFWETSYSKNSLDQKLLASDIPSCCACSGLEGDEYFGRHQYGESLKFLIRRSAIRGGAHAISDGDYLLFWAVRFCDVP